MGATFVVKLPDIGEGVVEAELVGWHVKVGDLVQEDQLLAEVMTDKATVEIPAPCAGRVTALAGEPGSRLAVGGELLRLEAHGAAPPREAEPPPAAEAAPPPAPDAMPDIGPEHPPAAEPPPPEASQPLAAEARPGPTGPAPLASPAVRQRARALGLDLRSLRGTGPGGRILHADLDALLRGGAPAPAATPAPAREPREGVQEIPVTGLRRVIATRMAEATRRIAHFSYVEEVDMTALEELRATLNEQGAAAGRPKLTPLPFLALAVIRAVADHPQMNAHYDDEAEVIRRHAAVHLGVAAQTPSGLMVPVLRHAEALGLREIAAGIARLAAAARDNSAKREELSGSTITVTSLGALGGIASTPVVNRPEVAIIGTNRLAIRPHWDGARFVPRAMMNLSSSFDHRVVDGHDAALFIRRIKALLETPALLFLEGP